MARIIDAFAQFSDGNGEPLVDGFLRFTQSGTNNTDKTTYKDVNLTIANANPVALDGEGRCPNVFGSGTYQVRLFDSGMQQIQVFDPVSSSEGGGAFESWIASKPYDEGALVTGSDIGYYRSIVPNNLNNDPTLTTGFWVDANIIPSGTLVMLPAPQVLFDDLWVTGPQVFDVSALYDAGARTLVLAASFFGITSSSYGHFKTALNSTTDTINDAYPIASGPSSFAANEPITGQGLGKINTINKTVAVHLEMIDVQLAGRKSVAVLGYYT